MSSSVGLKLIASLLDAGDLKQYSKVDVNPATFKEHELEVWDFVQQFVADHKALPKKGTVLQNLDDISLPIADEVPSYYAGQLKERFIADKIKASYSDVKGYLTKGSMDVVAGVDLLTKALMEIHDATHGRELLDFKKSADFIAKAYKEKKMLGLEGSVLFGYPTLDNMSGGMVGGDLISIVGRPAMGKTWQTLYLGHHAWYTQGRTVLYIPLEMTILAIAQRLASMNTKHPLKQIKKAQLATKAHKDLLKKLKVLENKDSSFWIAGGDLAATVEDIWKLTMQVNPDIVIVDGAYLLSHPNPRLGKFERVAENARSLKQMLAMDFNIPVVASWQFNRNAVKKMEKSKDNKAGLEDIGYTDEIGQLSSVVLGLTQEESIETILTRKVDILKGRDGEVGSFNMKWDFVKMDFSELPSSPHFNHSEEDEPELVVK